VSTSATAVQYWEHWSLTESGPSFIIFVNMLCAYMKIFLFFLRCYLHHACFMFLGLFCSPFLISITSCQMFLIDSTFLKCFWLHALFIENIFPLCSMTFTLDLVLASEEVCIVLHLTLITCFYCFMPLKTCPHSIGASYTIVLVTGVYTIGLVT
jgi:hypothetical protein